MSQNIEKLYNYIQENDPNAIQFGNLETFSEKVKDPDSAEKLREYLNDERFGDSTTFYNKLNEEVLEKEELENNLQDISKREELLQQEQNIALPQFETSIAESTQAQISPTHPISDDILDMNSSIAFANPEELLHSEIAKNVENSMTPPPQKDSVRYQDAIEIVQKQLDGLLESGSQDVVNNALWNVSGQNTANGRVTN